VIPTRKLDFSAFRNSYSISTYRTPLRRILGGNARLDELIRGRVQPLSPVVFLPGVVAFASAAGALNSSMPTVAHSAISARGNFLSVLYWTVHRACQNSRRSI